MAIEAQLDIAKIGFVGQNFKFGVAAALGDPVVIFSRLDGDLHRGVQSVGNDLVIPDGRTGLEAGPNDGGLLVGGVAGGDADRVGLLGEADQVALVEDAPAHDGG